MSYAEGDLLFDQVRTISPQWNVYALPESVRDQEAESVTIERGLLVARVTERTFQKPQYIICLIANGIETEHQTDDKDNVVTVIVNFANSL